MVDDNAKIFIGNRDGNGKKAIGNGLRSVEKGGDEVIIEKEDLLRDLAQERVLTPDSLEKESIEFA